MAGIAEPVSEMQEETGVARLSEEFRQVVMRIQEGTSGVVLGGLDPGALASVVEAEQTVDERALDLQKGAGDWDAWRTALVRYEAVWRDVLKTLGARRT